ncbi:MAG: 30S ribosomal protein S1 [Bacteroidales bacterium]|nr:30S ribosomal protein S1 [Bacteroidales bacterium]
MAEELKNEATEETQEEAVSLNQEVEAQPEEEIEEQEVEEEVVAIDEEESDDVEEELDEESEDDSDDIDVKAIIKPKSAIKESSLDDFDWDAYEQESKLKSDALKGDLSDTYEKTLKSINDKEVVSGRVMAMNSREIVVNIGFKSDGILSRNELRYKEDLKVGDSIDVYIESQEDVNGQLLLSHRKARVLKSWDRVNEALENEEVIDGFVKCRTKGGLIVDVFGIEAFLPGSQIDVKPIRDYDIYVGKTMEFKVVKINNEFKNVVVSHKALIQDELEKQKVEIMSKLEKGQILEGVVKNVTSYGVFVDLGGVDGLIHITDLSWGRINHPNEIVELDQKIQVVILDFDETKKRIALGMKQLTPHPWDSLDENLKVNDRVKGKVVVIADYGAFIEIAPGVEGLVHVSEMSWSQHLRTAQDFLNVGDDVEAMILTLDREERKMSMGIKQLIPDPWESIGEKYPKGSKHNAVVRNFTNFGIFVELEEGVDGLIHISDLSWSKKIAHPAEFTKIGDKIDVVVLDVDIDNRRLSLGHKQLEENPWDVFETVFAIDSVHEGTITQVGDKGAIVALPYGVEGFVPKRHMNKEEGGQLAVNDKVEFNVIEFNKENKKIILSHSKVFKDKKVADGKPADKKANENQTPTNYTDKVEKTTLGDLGVLAELKSEMQEEEKAKAEEFLKKMEKKEENDSKE